MPKLKSYGQTSIPLLVLVAFIGIISYLVITGTFPFKDKLLGSLYSKTPSQASEEIDLASQDANAPQTTISEEKWEKGDDLKNWNKITSSCTSVAADSNLTLNCQNISLSSKNQFSKDSPIIVSGSFLTSDPESSAMVGFATQGNQTVYQIHSPNDPIFNQSLHKFKIVYAPINNDHIVYYYGQDNPIAIEKAHISPNGNLNVSISCKGKCTFNPLTISGVIVD